MATRIEKAIGHHGFWGYSAAFDMNELSKYIDDNEDESTEPLNILLVLPGDLRHLLLTIARRRRHKKKKSSPLRPLNFYVLETTMEVFARELLLLQVLLDFEIPIRQRANTFLEIFGNTLVQERTSKYIANVGMQLHELLNKKANAPDSATAALFLENIIDLECLKFREVDKLCGIFRNTYSNNIVNNYKTRVNPSGVVTGGVGENYNTMVQLRDQRLRGLYEERYDSKHAAADWDFHYHFGKNIAKIIHIKIFREWRCGGTARTRPLREGETPPPITPPGIAFEFGDQVYTHNNATMLSYVEGRVNKGQEKGMAKEILGFWGDVAGSPYFSFGIDTADPKGALLAEEKKLINCIFEILNKDSGTEQHRHHAVEVSLYNILAMLYEIESGAPYRMRKAHDLYSGLGGIDNLFDKEGDKAESDTDTTTNSGAVKSVEDTEKEKEKEGKPMPSIEEGEDGDDGDMPSVEGLVTKKTKSAADGVPGVALTEDQLAAQAARQAQLDREHEELVLDQMLRRAENIVDTLDGVKIYPVTGATIKEALCNTGSNVYTGSSVDDKGDPIAHIPSVKSKFTSKFDVVFISSRVGQLVAEPYFQQLLRRPVPVGLATRAETSTSSRLPRAPSANNTTSHPNPPPAASGGGGGGGKKGGSAGKKGGSVICVETSKYLVPLNNDEKEVFDAKIHQYATAEDIMTDRMKKRIAAAASDDDDDDDDSVTAAAASRQEIPTTCQNFTALKTRHYPINRRTRDDEDTMKDVVFFTSGNI